MRIDVFHFEGCPNHRPTVELVRAVVRELGLAVEVNEIEVGGLEDAVRLGFFGSPTVQVDGEDIDPASRGRVDYSFSCRVYDGSGIPSRALIERAIRERMAS